MPAVIYGAKQAATLIALDPRDVMRELTRGGWRSRVYQVNAGGEPSRTLMREVQFHPVTDKPLHVDFQRLAPGERIRLGVSVQFRGDATSPGIKKGGVLNVVRHTVEVLADPDQVPEAFVADLAGGVSLRVFGETLMGIALALHLEGPAPYLARGRGSIDLFLFEVSFDFEVGWGSPPPPGL